MALGPLTAQFADELASDMKTLGFRKTGATWHRDLDEMIQVVNIQKSPWSDRFYINVGVYLKSLGAESRPTEYRCHLRCRAERLLDAAESAEFCRLLDFDEPMPLAQRYLQLRAFIARSALAWLDKNSTKAAQASAWQDLRPKHFFVLKGVAECLDIKEVL